MNGDAKGWSKQSILEELLPMLRKHQVTYFQWSGLTVSFDGNTKAEPKPMPAEPATVVPTGK